MAQTPARTRPDPALADGATAQDNRFTGYKEPYIFPVKTKLYPLADEGSYFVATNPTPGTGIAGHAAPTTMDNTKPFILVQNLAPPGGRNIYLDYIKLVVSAVGAGGTTNYATHLTDPGAGYTSGGSSIVAVNPNLNSGQRSAASIYMGAVVATASGNQRLVASQNARTVIAVVGDVLLFNFGTETQALSNMPLEGTLQLERVMAVPPVILVPQGWYKLVLWRASQSGANSYEIEMGYWER
jgi:hypothetical protein